MVDDFVQPPTSSPSLEMHSFGYILEVIEAEEWAVDNCDRDAGECESA